MSQELKQIRELMTKEHWEEWLTDARNERKRRRAASDPAVDRQPQQIPATYHTESAKFKEAPSPKSIIKTRVLDKRSIKSINKLVKKKEADRSISVLKDALEHLWAKVVDEAGPRSTLNPPNVDISGLDNPGAAAKILLADIQAQVKKSNPADQQRLDSLQYISYSQDADILITFLQVVRKDSGIRSGLVQHGYKEVT